MLYLNFTGTKDMISNYSSLIELFSAIYVTMAIELKYFRDIWSPSSNNALEEILRKEEGFEDLDGHIELIRKNINELHNSLAILTNRRGGFMVSVCVLLLIFCGYEQGMCEKTQDQAFIALDISLLIGCVLMSLSKYIMTKWKAVFFYIVAMVLTFFYCLFYVNFSINDRAVGIIRYTTPTFVVLIVIIPVVYHLMVNWLFHGVYQGYFRNEMSKAIAVYNNAYKDKINNPTEHEDIDTSEIKGKLTEDIENICRPGLSTLLWSLTKHYYSRSLISIQPFNILKDRL